MWQQKLCLATFRRHELEQENQIEIFQNAGFDGFFIEWSPDGVVERCRKKADETGMLFQSVHAPFGKSRAMWEGGDGADEGVAQLTACLRDCADNGVDLAILHTYIGFDTKPEPTQIGLENYGKIVELQKNSGCALRLKTPRARNAWRRCSGILPIAAMSAFVGIRGTKCATTIQRI